MITYNWHDLTIDSTDLPNDERPVEVKLNENGPYFWKTGGDYYIQKYHHWRWNPEGNNVIAWREIPIHKKGLL